MTIGKMQWALAGIVLAGGATLSTPASAGTGCNGVINPFVWGCAPWDNNNGPKFPYYNAPKVRVKPTEGRVQTINGAQMVVMNSGQRMPLIGMDGATMVAAGGGN